MTEPEVRQSAIPIVLWAITAVVIVFAIIAGLMLTGGPEVQRAKRMDEHRARDFGEIQRMIADYYQLNHKLPETLEVLTDAQARHATRDPVTSQPYEYRKTNDDTFELCATFQIDTTKERRFPYESPYGDAGNVHPVGRYCYALKKLESNGRPDDFIRFQRVSARP